METKEQVLGMFAKGANTSNDYEKAMVKVFGKLLCEFTVEQLLEMGVFEKYAIRESSKKDGAYYAQFKLANGQMGFAASNEKAYKETDNSKIKVSFREKGRTAFVTGNMSEEDIEWRD